MNSSNKHPISSIEDILKDYAYGKMIIVIDDEDRENEGDLFIASEHVTHESINFMAKYGRGLICLCLTEEKCEQLNLPLMVNRNSAAFSTNFTISIEAAKGVTTGISTYDRAKTIRAAIKEGANPEDLVSPGHVFPIKALGGGVLKRAGHTEAGVDLAALAGLQPTSVICEILKEDGTLARLPDLVNFAKEHHLKICTIEDLIRYRLENTPTIQRVTQNYLTIHESVVDVYVYQDNVEHKTHIALVKGTINPEVPIAVRVHNQPGVLDSILYSNREIWPLDEALECITDLDSGIVIVLSNTERSEEVVTKIMQQTKSHLYDTSHKSNELRMLGTGGQILADLGVKKILALGREKKTYGIAGFGLEIVTYLENKEELMKWYANGKK